MKLEQIAIATDKPAVTMAALTAVFGLKTGFSSDEVAAKGTVFDSAGENKACLNFNYELGFELEVLTYLEGASWHDDRRFEGHEFPFVSHIGYHCTKTECQAKISEMAKLGVDIAQEVFTQSHTNPVIAGQRKYHYVVFDSKGLLGFDLKLIVRINMDGSEYVESAKMVVGSCGGDTPQDYEPNDAK